MHNRITRILSTSLLVLFVASCSVGAQGDKTL